jgi:hypothetical protein
VLRGARVVERTEAATLVEMELEASNPGDTALPLRDVTYTATSPWGTHTMTRSAQAVLGPFATRSVKLPIAIPSDLGDGPFELAMDGQVVYVPDSIVRQTLTDLGAPDSVAPVSGTVQVSGVLGASGGR